MPCYLHPSYTPINTQIGSVQNTFKRYNVYVLASICEQTKALRPGEIQIQGGRGYGLCCK